MDLYHDGIQISDEFEQRVKQQQMEDLPLSVAIVIGVQMLVALFLIIAAITMH